VVKTNQTHGAEVALRAARRWSKPLIARCGYIWSLFASWKEGAYSDAAQRARVQEAEVFRAAQRVAVTTEEMKHYIIEQYGIPSDRVRVIPNYVLTELFRPDPDGGHQQGRLCFVGRLESQKNLFALLEAVRGLEVELEIIGDGPQRKALEEEAGKKGIKAFFLGNLPHSELPRRFNSAEIVVLPSLYEGHPKSLIEAMACGRPVVASDAPGIREIVSHRETGYLSAPTPGGIRAALEEVLGNATLRERMGRAARAFVLERFTLEQAVKAEVELLGELVK
jgi:glycosyltransferase involved in cell wall biosynthesis